MDDHSSPSYVLLIISPILLAFVTYYLRFIILVTDSDVYYIQINDKNYATGGVHSKWINIYI